MKKDIIYYTDSRLGEPIISLVQKEILEAQLPVISVSLKPMSFGQNIVLDLEPSILTMLKQILTALETSKADTVFFCEHDVLYHKMHFDFEPPSKDIYYYNTNVWRWRYPFDLLITYSHLRSLSGLCVNRELVTEHYRRRLKVIETNGWHLKYGFEPGTKRKRIGGITNEGCDEWKSKFPNIDIRHKGTLTPPKCHLTSFKHKPFDWQTTTLEKVPDWDLKRMFNL